MQTAQSLWIGSEKRLPACYSGCGAGPGLQPVAGQRHHRRPACLAPTSRVRWRRWSVAYTPDWEALADALQRVKATGATEDEARRDVCLALSDQKIRVQVRIADTEAGMRGETRSGGVVVPRDLTPDDFDWVLSRPLKPWLIGPASVAENYFSVSGTESRRIVLIKLFRADVTKILRGGERANNNPEKQPSTTAAQENVAIKGLATLLKTNRDLKKADALARCREMGFAPTDRGFQNRVWPGARKQADLDAKAPPGRKRKS
jgi:hypothetical protein